jgi:fructokinase
MQNANSIWLNGRALDLVAALAAPPVRLANDANCFALSKASDGAAANAEVVFGVIPGTRCGGGIVVNGRLFDGPRGIGGQLGHNPPPGRSLMKDLDPTIGPAITLRMPGAVSEQSRKA